MENASTQTPPFPAAAAPGGEPHNLIYRVCRVLTAIAWTVIILWVLAPRGSRWAGAAFNAGLAWILLTGGGYFAEQTVRSFVRFCKNFPASCDEAATCNTKDHSSK